jgi:putative FmdB family regulatory protein
MLPLQYRCRTCGRHFEIISSNSENEKVPECPYCQSQDIEFTHYSVLTSVEKLDAAASLASASNCGSPGLFR